MMHIKKVGWFTLTIASSIGVLMASTADAVRADTDVDTMMMTGVVGLQVPIPPVDFGILGLLLPAPYTFQGGCVVATSSDGAVTTNCNVASTGTYTNIDCGTGIMTGDLDYVDNVTGETTAAAYDFILVNGIGVVDSIVGSGVVDLVPTNATSGGCVTQYINAFTMTGVFTFIG